MESPILRVSPSAAADRGEVESRGWNPVPGADLPSVGVALFCHLQWEALHGPGAPRNLCANSHAIPLYLAVGFCEQVFGEAGRTKDCSAHLKKAPCVCLNAGSWFEKDWDPLPCTKRFSTHCDTFLKTHCYEPRSSLFICVFSSVCIRLDWFLMERKQKILKRHFALLFSSLLKTIN